MSCVFAHLLNVWVKESFLAWCPTPITIAFGTRRQENHNFEVILGNLAIQKDYLKIKNKSINKSINSARDTTGLSKYCAHVMTGERERESSWPSPPPPAVCPNRMPMHMERRTQRAVVSVFLEEPRRCQVSPGLRLRIASNPISGFPSRPGYSFPMDLVPAVQSLLLTPSKVPAPQGAAQSLLPQSHTQPHHPRSCATLSACLTLFPVVLSQPLL